MNGWQNRCSFSILHARDQEVVSVDISDVKITGVTIDSTTAVIMSKGIKYPAVFYKKL